MLNKRIKRIVALEEESSDEIPKKDKDGVDIITNPKDSSS